MTHSIFPIVVDWKRTISAGHFLKKYFVAIRMTNRGMEQRDTATNWLWHIA